MKKTEKRINLIEGFLPTEVGINIASMKRSSESIKNLRRNSSFHMDAKTRYMLDKIAYAK